MAKEEKEMYRYTDFIYSYEGIAIGKALKIIRNINDSDINVRKIQPAEVETEIEKLRDVIKKLKEKEERSLKEGSSDSDKEIKTIGEAYILLISDIETKIIEKINSNFFNAEYAALEVIKEIKSRIWNFKDEYLRERIHDLDIIKNQIIGQLKEIFSFSIEELLASFSNKDEIIVVADEIMPSEFSFLKKDKRITGLILGKGGKTSHMAIMAKNLKLPTILGASQIINNINKNDYIIIDTYYEKKVIIINPDKKTLKEYRNKKTDKEKEDKKIISDTTKSTTTTKDGVRIKVMANIEIQSDIEKVIEYKTDGVGLYRTEFIFLPDDETRIPISFLFDEEKQFNIYKNLISKIGDSLPIIIRTFDFEKGHILEESSEKNPALGMRSIRYCMKNLDIFRTQLRAILRASHHGYIKVLFPMITGFEELRDVKTVLEDIKRGLEVSDEYFDDRIEIGVMLEIPSLAFSLDLIKPEVDFIAIGTNDLLQYFFAVDRGNIEVNYLYNPYSISFLRFLGYISQHVRNKETYLCGEITSDPFFILFSIGLGFRSFSVPLSDVPKIKHIIKNVSISECENFANKILGLTSLDDINKEFESFYSKNVVEKEKN